MGFKSHGWAAPGKVLLDGVPCIVEDPKSPKHGFGARRVPEFWELQDQMYIIPSLQRPLKERLNWWCSV